MKNNLGNRIGLVLFLCLVLLSLSCGGKVTTRTTPDEHKFTINGVVVKDLNLGKDIAAFTIWRNSDLFNGALVKVGSHTVPNEVNGTYVKEESLLFNFERNVSINISENDFSLDTSFVMPGNFHINTFPLTGDTLNPGGAPVPVTWSTSLQAFGYILSVVTPHVTPSPVGHTSLLKGREKTIPLDAFRTTQGDLVEGVYEIYVIAYYGSFLEYPGMAIELPEGLPTGNLDGANGTIGAGVVAQKKRIRVVAE